MSLGEIIIAIVLALTKRRRCIYYPLSKRHLYTNYWFALALNPFWLSSSACDTHIPVFLRSAYTFDFLSEELKIG